MFGLKSSLISKRNQFKKNSLYYDLIDELIEIIDDINNLKFAEEAKNIIEELNELKKEFIDDKEYINIIDTQIKNVHDNISKLAIKNDPITIRIRELEKNKPQCTNKNCSNLLEIKNTTTNDFFWSCPDFPKCWGKKRLTNEEYFFITKGTLIPEKKEAIKKDTFNEKIYNSLKTWRYHKSKELEIPPYYICTNAVIDELSSTIIEDINQLTEIKGIGDKFVEKYGSEVIKILSTFNENKSNNSKSVFKYKKLCQNCKLTNDKNANYCSNCGTKLE